MKSTTALRFLQSVLIYLAALVIVGCDGSASMRIDVEVYNGPLAKTKEAQFAELEGSLEHAMRALKVVKDDLFISECRLGCRGDTAPECWKVEQESEKQEGNTPTKEIWFETYTEEKWKRVADKTPPQCLLKRLFCSKYEVEEVKRFKTSNNTSDSFNGQVAARVLQFYSCVNQRNQKMEVPRATVFRVYCRPYPKPRSHNANSSPICWDFC